MVCLFVCVCLCEIAISNLSSFQGAPASADEYLPVLIYAILRANPPQLQSNVKFISRFALPSKVDTGEAGTCVCEIMNNHLFRTFTGYYYTNLCCALKFVQNLNADSLKMPRDEFEAYTSGQMIPPINEANSRCHQV
jgi:hypothetical protein